MINTHFIDKNNFMNRICTRCNKQLELNNFHNCKGGKFGKHSICKLCRKQDNKKNDLDFIDLKFCNKCNIRKGIIDFYQNNPTHCKDCHKLAISISLSKLEPYLNMLYKKFIKKHKKSLIYFTNNDLIEKYKKMDGKCEISGVQMEHIVNKKQQFDNIWNISILYPLENDNTKILNNIEIDDIKLVCHLAKTMNQLYKMDDIMIKNSIQKLKID